MMPDVFSRRLTWDLTPNALTLAIERRRARGDALLDLTGSNPTAAGLPIAGGEILAALGDPEALVYRPDPRGLPSAREALAAWLGRDGRRVSPERLFLSSSTSEAYGWLFELLADPGDAILTPTPSYPLFEYLAGRAGLVLRPWRLEYDGRWNIDRASVLDAARAGARAIVAIHPNNPTGSFLSNGDLAFLAETAGRDLALISDEVFVDFALTEAPGRAPTALAQERCLTFVLGGLSKAAGLPQMKLAWIVVGGPDDLVEQAIARLELIADSVLSPSAPIQHALPRILALIPAFQAAARARLRANLAVAARVFAPPAAASLLPVEGGWTLPLRLPAVHTGEQWAIQLVDDEGILVQPGYFYDFEGEAFVVVSLLTPELDFAAGLSRLRAAVDRSIIPT